MCIFVVILIYIHINTCVYVNTHMKVCMCHMRSYVYLSSSLILKLIRNILFPSLRRVQLFRRFLQTLTHTHTYTHTRAHTHRQSDRQTQRNTRLRHTDTRTHRHADIYPRYAHTQDTATHPRTHTQPTTSPTHTQKKCTQQHHPLTQIAAM